MVLQHVVGLQLVVGGPAGDHLLVVQRSRAEPGKNICCCGQKIFELLESIHLIQLSVTLLSGLITDSVLAGPTFRGTKPCNNNNIYYRYYNML